MSKDRENVLGYVKSLWSPVNFHELWDILGKDMPMGGMPPTALDDMESRVEHGGAKRIGTETPPGKMINMHPLGVVSGVSMTRQNLCYPSKGPSVSRTKTPEGCCCACSDDEFGATGSGQPRGLPAFVHSTGDPHLEVSLGRPGFREGFLLAAFIATSSARIFPMTAEWPGAQPKRIVRLGMFRSREEAHRMENIVSPAVLTGSEM